MSVETNIKTARTLSWGSIIAGIVTVLAVSILLSMLGSSLGLAMIAPTSDDPVNGAGTAIGVWTLFSIVFSLLAGAFIAGRLAGYDGMIHGFLNWASALIVATVLGTMLIGASVKTAGSALGAIASVTGSALSGSGELLGKGLSSVGDAGQSLFEQITLDTHLHPDNLQDEVENALKQSGIPALHPDFLKQQLQGAKDDIMAMARRVAVGSLSSDQAMGMLVDKLKQRSQTIAASINRDDIKRALAQNTALTAAESDRMVENIINTRDHMVLEVNQRIDEAQMKIEQLQQQLEEWKAEAAQQAEQMAHAAAKAALWSFFALLLGAIVSAFGGMWGAKTKSRRHA